MAADIDRILRETGHLFQFGELGQYLQQQGVASITRTHACHEPPRHAQRKAGVLGR